MGQPGGFSLSFYFETLRRMVLAPGDFLEAMPESTGLTQPLGFLLLSSLVHAVLSLALLPARPLLTAVILFLNAVLMPVIAAVIGHALMAAMRKRSPLSRVLAVYAYAAGTTHILSWIPLAVWLMEPWKWLLIGIGMVKGCGLSRLQAAAVIIVSIVSIIVLFSLFSPLTVRFKA